MSLNLAAGSSPSLYFVVATVIFVKNVSGLAISCLETWISEEKAEGGSVCARKAAAKPSREQRAKKKWKVKLDKLEPAEREREREQQQQVAAAGQPRKEKRKRKRKKRESEKSKRERKEQDEVAKGEGDEGVKREEEVGGVQVKVEPSP